MSYTETYFKEKSTERARQIKVRATQINIQIEQRQNELDYHEQVMLETENIHSEAMPENLERLYQKITTHLQSDIRYLRNLLFMERSEYDYKVKF